MRGEAEARADDGEQLHFLRASISDERFFRCGRGRREFKRQGSISGMSVWYREGWAKIKPFVDSMAFIDDDDRMNPFSMGVIIGHANFRNLNAGRIRIEATTRRPRPAQKIVPTKSDPTS